MNNKNKQIGFFQRRKNKKLRDMAEELEKKLELFDAGELYLRIGDTQRALAIAKQLEDTNQLRVAKNMYTIIGQFEKVLEIDAKIEEEAIVELINRTSSEEKAEYAYLAGELEKQEQYKIAGDFYLYAGNRKKYKEMYDLAEKKEN